MANSLGKLVVSLGLDAAEFTAGLTKAEFEAQKFKKRLESGVASAASGAAVGIGLISAAAVAAAVAIDTLVKNAARFKDLEEITGASAESLASMAVAASVAGTDMNAVAEASVRLTKNLTGVDDESKAAGAALAAIGISIKEFKALDPAAQMEAVAKALANFKDGAGKTAVAVALLGKSGAQLLPFLKELADGVGRQTILTQQQIERADAFADAQARSAAQVKLYAQALATETLPAITAFQEALKETIKGILDVDSAAKGLAGDNPVNAFAEGGARALAILADALLNVVDGFRKGGIVIGAIAAQIQSGSFAAAKAIKEEADAQLKSIDARKSILSLLDQQLEKQKRVAAISQLIPESVKPQNKPTINFQGAAKNDGSAERQSEAERFLESLQKQLEKTQELGAVEQALAEIQRGRLKGLTPELQKEILFTAARIDQEKELRDELEASAKAQQELARAQARAAEERQRSVDAAFNEAVAIKDSNDAIRDEIAILMGGLEARQAIEQAHIASAIAKREDALATELLNNGEGDTANFLRAQISLLKERQGLLLSREVAANLRAEAEALRQFSDSIASELGGALADVVTGTKSLKDAFTDLTNSITRQIAQIAAQNLAKSLFGGIGSTDIGGILSKIFGGILGFGGGGGGFEGLGGFANGTNFAPGGLAVVGERGPEVVDLPRGSKVIPNEVFQQKREQKIFNITVNTQVMPGANTQSARQAAALVRDAVTRSARDR